MGDDTGLYRVRMPDGSLMQNQLTSLPGNDTRVRTAQGFYMGNPTYASYYRERRVTMMMSSSSFSPKHAETTTSSNQIIVVLTRPANPRKKDCDEHFGLTDEGLDPSADGGKCPSMLASYLEPAPGPPGQASGQFRNTQQSRYLPRVPTVSLLYEWALVRSTFGDNSPSDNGSR